MKNFDEYPLVATFISKKDAAELIIGEFWQQMIDKIDNTHPLPYPGQPGYCDLVIVPRAEAITAMAKAEIARRTTTTTKENLAVVDKAKKEAIIVYNAIFAAVEFRYAM